MQPDQGVSCTGRPTSTAHGQDRASLGSGRKRPEPRGIFFRRNPSFSPVSEAAEGHLIQVEVRYPAPWGWPPLVPLPPIISLPSKPPMQVGTAPGPGSLFLASPAEGSRAELRRVGWGRDSGRPPLTKVQGALGLALCSRASRCPYPWVVFPSAWLCPHFCAPAWVSVSVSRACIWVCMYLPRRVHKSLCICLLRSWVICVCLLISFLHVPALHMTPWVCRCTCDLCLGIYTWSCKEKREKQVMGMCWAISTFSGTGCPLSHPSSPSVSTIPSGWWSPALLSFAPCPGKN